MVKKKVEKKVIITQLKSTISQTLRQKRTITALGLGKINRSVEKNLSPEIQGMINKVNHLVKVKNIEK
jgi:large subunit ribosomal protein L30|tara:strand:- start:20666 stop:20869 length:204 start_codon:yes stop_codon:yes gene_type:complete